jgi:uncharacterized membrane protein
MQNRPKPAAIALALFSILYPVVAVFLVRTIGPGAALGIILVVLVARVFWPGFDAVPLPLTIGLIVVVCCIGVLAPYDKILSIRLYPVFMNAAMLVAFVSTLIRPPSMIERFARLAEPDLPESGRRYTRVVTAVWAGFFVVNGSIALWTVFTPGWRIWTAYNGFISYLLVGILFSAEYLVRQHVRRKL